MRSPACARIFLQNFKTFELRANGVMSSPASELMALDPRPRTPHGMHMDAGGNCMRTRENQHSASLIKLWGAAATLRTALEENSEKSLP